MIDDNDAYAGMDEMADSAEEHKRNVYKLRSDSDFAETMLARDAEQRRLRDVLYPDHWAEDDESDQQANWLFLGCLLFGLVAFVGACVLVGYWLGII